ncbi:Ku protein [Granulicella mallensis]|uniref:Non-homologous end joining protein Ku n=1 Tax=Granulicella mallensis TaxID=940614 RepID=A0A7W7ZT97_9BACT|nr:Ku protein [Granulicella mallensis]MBB5065745.1 DNA end-binding protein Ku [Granulicella mallensis]
MARPYWSGQIQISLVSFGVKLFVATEAKSDIHFHQIDRKTGERVRHQKVLASAIENDPDEAADSDEVVERSQIVKGYEYSKGQYVTIEPEELEHLRVPSKHTMEVTQFVDREQLPPEFFEKPYFVVPENDAQTEAFTTVRQALEDTGKAAISKIAFGGREHVVAIVPAGSEAHGGMMAYTMRYAAELRDPAEYFQDIKKTKVSSDSLALAKELIKRKAKPFDPSKFVDGYEVAVKELVEAKLKHAPVPREESPAPAKGKVINLMDALRKSVSGDSQPAKKTAAKKHGLALVKGAVKKQTHHAAKSKATPKRKSA